MTLRKIKNENSVYGLETFSSNDNREACHLCALNYYSAKSGLAQFVLLSHRNPLTYY